MDEQKMTELYELTKENNKMLRMMRRSAFVGGIIKFIFWFVLLVVIPYLTWLYLEPYLKQITDTYQSVQGQADSFANFDFGKLLEQFKGTAQ